MRVDSITSEEQIKQLEDYLLVNNERDYVIFKIGTNLGLRVSDFLEMPAEERKRLRKEGKKDYYDVKYFTDMCKRGMVCLTQQKTDKPVYFEIPSEIKKLILKYTEGRNADEPMFLSRFGGKAFTRVGFFLAMKDAAKAIGLTDNIGCHTMRKVFGYFYYKKYNDIRQLMAIFNHSDPSVTLRYIGIDQEEINKNTREFEVGEFKTVEDIQNKDALIEAKKRMLEEKKALKKNKSDDTDQLE